MFSYLFCMVPRDCICNISIQNAVCGHGTVYFTPGKMNSSDKDGTSQDAGYFALAGFILQSAKLKKKIPGN